HRARAPSGPAGAGAGGVGATLDGLLADARATAADEQRPADARAEALRSLRFAALGDVQALLTGLLAPRQPPAVQAAAIETLTRFDDAGVPAILLGAWRELSPKLRATAAEALFTRPAWLAPRLDAVGGGPTGRAEVDPPRLELLKSSPDAPIRARAARLFAGAQPRRQDVVAAYQDALRLKGDPRRGKEVFRAQCSVCHRLEG